MTQRCDSPIPLEELIAWERGELDGEADEKVEEHVFGCARCARELEVLARLAAGIGALLQAGDLPVAVTADLAEYAAQRGSKLRSYRVAPGRSVHCTAAPDDDFVVLRLGVDVGEAETLDLVAEFTDLETGQRETRRNDDVVVDRTRGEIVYLQPGDFIRSLPRSLWSVSVAWGPTRSTTPPGSSWPRSPDVAGGTRATVVKTAATTGKMRGGGCPAPDNKEGSHATDLLRPPRRRGTGAVRHRLR